MAEALPNASRTVPAPISGGLLPLKLDNVCLARGQRTILDQVTLSIGAGAPTVIMGANGAGKSVLLRVMNGLLKPTSGSIQWGDVPDGRGADADVAGRRSALVFQRPVLLRRTVEDNIAFILRHRPRAGVRRTAREVLTDAGLAHLAGAPARHLSGGEQQRLAIARALASLPEVLFLDEPTASLDPSATQLVERMIVDASRAGAKVVLVTHDIGQARRLAGEVVFLAHGTISEQTPAAAFFSRPRSPAAAAYLAGDLWLPPDTTADV